jgi:hypothetical protein
MNRRILWKAAFCLLAVWVCPGWSRLARAECGVPVPSSPGAAEPLALGKYPSQEKLNELKIMNYYPSAHSWADMWNTWEPATIDKDFGLIASMHANTVRIIVNADAFGFPDPAPAMLSELQQAIDMACSHGLRVQLTLFDWWHTYSDTKDSKTWVDTVVGPYKNDPRIAFVELQNEISPDENTSETKGSMAWARVMVPYLQNAVGDIPVTLSVTDGVSDDSTELTRLVAALKDVRLDFLDMHQYYGSPVEDYYELSQAKQFAEKEGLALLIGETGTSTYHGDYSNSTIAIPATQESREEWQSYAFRSAFYAASKLGLPAPAPWVLWDFEPGSLAWICTNTTAAQCAANQDQYDFGLYRTDGKPKKVAADVSRFFTNRTVDTSFNSGFESYSGSPGLPNLWQINESDKKLFAIDTKVAHTGHASASISNSAAVPNDSPSFYITPVVPIERTATYAASVYVRLQNATGTTQICISTFNSDFKYLQDASGCGESLSGTTVGTAKEWKLTSVTETVPSNAAYVQIFLTSSNNTGTAWFDDVSFRKTKP